MAIAIAIDGVAGLAGGMLPERVLERHRTLLLGFAIGALCAAVACDLGPDAWAALGPRALAWGGGGALATLLAGRLFDHQHGHQGHRHAATPAPARGLPYALLGSDALHNFGDGMAIAAAFAQSVHIGLATSLAVIVHEVPEEIADYALLRESGWPRRRALVALGGVQLTAALGAAATLAGISRVAGLADIAVAIAAGTFAAIIAQLAPGLVRERAGRVAALGGALLGAAAVYVVS